MDEQRDGGGEPAASKRPDRRKPYRSPRLSEYGDLRKITQAGKASNRSDAAGAPATKR